MKGFILIPASEVKIITSLNVTDKSEFSEHFRKITRKILEDLYKYDNLLILTKNFKNFFVDISKKIRVEKALLLLLKTRTNISICMELDYYYVLNCLNILNKLNFSSTTKFQFTCCLRQHAKIFVFGGKSAYIGSANVTGAAIGKRTYIKRNIELGMTCKNPEFISWLSEYVHLISTGSFCKKCLKRRECMQTLEKIIQTLQQKNRNIKQVEFIQQNPSNLYKNPDIKFEKLENLDLDTNILFFNHFQKIPYVILKFLFNATTSSIKIYAATLHPINIEYKGKEMNIFTVMGLLLKQGVKIELFLAALPENKFSKDSLEILKKENLTKFSLTINPTLHAKCIIVDEEYCYIGSANLTAAGMGRRSEHRRNFEIGALFSNKALIKQVVLKFMVFFG